MLDILQACYLLVIFERSQKCKRLRLVPAGKRLMQVNGTEPFPIINWPRSSTRTISIRPIQRRSYALELQKALIHVFDIFDREGMCVNIYNAQNLQ